MKKMVCDISGVTPADTYSFVKDDGTVLFSIDLCATCAENVMKQTRAAITVDDLTPSIKKDVQPANNTTTL